MFIFWQKIFDFQEFGKDTNVWSDCKATGSLVMLLSRGESVNSVNSLTIQQMSVVKTTLVRDIGETFTEMSCEGGGAVPTRALI